MNILVTGGAGFIGSHLVDRYIEEGHTVVVIDNLSSGKKTQVNPSATFYEMDILDENVQDVFAKEKPSVVNHHAAQIDVRTSVVDPAFDATVNLIGFLRIMEAGRMHGLKRIIFASSGGAIYPDADVFPTPEDHPPRPQSPYGVTKIATEYYLEFYKKTYHVPYISLRYGNVYGPRQDPGGEAGVVAIFIGNALRQRQPTIFGNGEQVRDYVFIDDVVEANVAALHEGTEGIFNIGTGVGTSVNALWSKIQAMGESDVVPLHAPARAGEAQKSILSPTHAGERLGWRPKTSLVQGLSRTIAFFRGQQP